MKVLQLILVLVVVVVVISTTTTSLLPMVEMVPIDRAPNENDTAPITDNSDHDSAKPAHLDKNKICQLICKNNPGDGGKFCFCDTYALRISGTNHADCNRLI